MVSAAVMRAIAKASDGSLSALNKNMSPQMVTSIQRELKIMTQSRAMRLSKKNWFKGWLHAKVKSTMHSSGDNWSAL